MDQMNQEYRLNSYQEEALLKSHYFQSMSLSHEALIELVTSLINEDISREEYDLKYKEYHPNGWKGNQLRNELDAVLFTQKPKMLRRFRINGISMSYDGKYSLDPGDEVIGALKSANQLYEADFIMPKLFIFIKNDAWIHVVTILNYSSETKKFRVATFNPDKVQYPDFDILEKEIQGIYEVTTISKHRN